MDSFQMFRVYAMYNALCKDKVFKLKTKIGIVNSIVFVERLQYKKIGCVMTQPIFNSFRVENYSPGTIASLGQFSAQVPQSIQVSGSIL